MSENRITNRVRMIFPPRELGTFKTHKYYNGNALATSTKGGRLASSPSHIFDGHTKAWSRIDESKSNSSAKDNIIKKLQSAPASPRFVDDVTKVPSLDLDHTKNALDQRLSSLTSTRKLDLAVP